VRQQIRGEAVDFILSTSAVLFMLEYNSEKNY